MVHFLSPRGETPKQKGCSSFLLAVKNAVLKLLTVLILKGPQCELWLFTL